MHDSETNGENNRMRGCCTASISIRRKRFEGIRASPEGTSGGAAGRMRRPIGRERQRMAARMRTGFRPNARNDERQMRGLRRIRRWRECGDFGEYAPMDGRRNAPASSATTIRRLPHPNPHPPHPPHPTHRPRRSNHRHQGSAPWSSARQEARPPGAPPRLPPLRTGSRRAPTT